MKKHSRRCPICLRHLGRFQTRCRHCSAVKRSPLQHILFVWILPGVAIGLLLGGAAALYLHYFSASSGQGNISVASPKPKK